MGAFNCAPCVPNRITEGYPKEVRYLYFCGVLCELQNLPIHAKIYANDVVVLLNPNKTTMVLFTKKNENWMILPVKNKKKLFWNQHTQFMSYANGASYRQGDLGLML